MKKLVLFAALIMAAPFVSSAQDEEEDPKRMIREVVNVEMEKPKEVKPPPVVVEEPKGKKGKKKHVEEEPPPVEENFESEGPTLVPATPAELSKRATSWYNTKSKKYAKEQGSNSSTKMTCVISAPYKPKELNPTNDVEGKLTMNVTIEFKEGKYRYTIDKMEHTATRGVCSGGDVFNDVPACGSMNLNSGTWKQIKSAALAQAKLVADDLKATMAKPVSEAKKDDW